jgi:hypothetical protein
MAEEKKVGTGITQRVDVVIEAETATEEDWRKVRQDMEAVNQYQRRGGAMADIRARASAILIHDKEPLTEHSRKWYAREVLKLLNFMKGYADNGESIEALNIAIAVGALWKEADMKFQWERFALVGDKVINHGGGGHGVTVDDARAALQWAETSYPAIGKTQQKEKAASKIVLKKTQFYELIKK